MYVNNDERYEDVDSRLETCSVKTEWPQAPYPSGWSYADAHFIWAPYRRFYERYTPNSTGRRNEWKSFQHYKIVCGSAPPMSGTTFADATHSSWYLNGEGMAYDPYAFYDNRYGDGGKLNSELPSWYTPESNSGFVPLPDMLDELVAAAMRSLLPNIRPELSLLNSIYELKDFKSLPRTLTNLKLSKLFSKRASGTLRNVLREGASNYLQLEFNILPLLSDISSVYAALSRIERRINDLISRSGRMLTRHFTRVIMEDDSSTRSSSTQSLGGIGPHNMWTSDVNVAATAEWERLVITDPAIFHAEVRYNYNYTDYQVEHARLLGLLDSFGINLNPAIIWNAIPWSFVVDWVFGVSRWLNDQRIGLMDPKINIHGFLWSFKRRRQMFVSRKVKYGLLQGGPSDRESAKVTLPVVTETAYRRECGLPDSSSIVSSGLNSKEFSLAAALVVSRRRRRRKSYIWKDVANRI